MRNLIALPCRDILKECSFVSGEEKIKEIKKERVDAESFLQKGVGGTALDHRKAVED